MKHENIVATTKDWLKTEEGMRITAYDPSWMVRVDSELEEPGQAINLPAADRARMNRAKSGAHARPERL
jgi:hypothetical protein